MSDPSSNHVARLSPEEFQLIRSLADKTLAGSTFRKLLWQIEQLEAEIARLSAVPIRVETTRKPREQSATDRLHNICDALSEQADESPFTREERDAIDRQTVRLTNALRGLIDAVRNVEIDASSWRQFMAYPLQSAYRALKHEDPLSPLAAAVEIARGEPPTDPVRFAQKTNGDVP